MRRAWEHADFAGLFENPDDDSHNHSRDDGKHADRSILAAEEGVGAFEDCAGDFLHRGRALVTPENIKCQPNREEHRGYRGQWNHDLGQEHGHPLLIIWRAITVARGHEDPAAAPKTRPSRPDANNEALYGPLTFHADWAVYPLSMRRRRSTYSATASPGRWWAIVVR